MLCNMSPCKIQLNVSLVDRLECIIIVDVNVDRVILVFVHVLYVLSGDDALPTGDGHNKSYCYLPG